MRQAARDSSLGNSDKNLEVLSDIQTLQVRAHQGIEVRPDFEEDVVTSGYATDRTLVITLLNIALVAELVCVLRYKRHYYMLKGIHAESLIAEFLQHANHLAKRITELGSEPDFSPDGLGKGSHAERMAEDTLNTMIKEDLITKRIAIESYREMIAFLADADSTAQQMLKEVEGHVEDLALLMENLKPEMTSLVM